MKDEKLALLNLLSKNRRNIENYKSVKANIEFSADRPKVILVTSSVPGEGKSNVSMNLARSFAMDGKRVLLLDCDLRKSIYSKRLKISDKENIGFAEALKGTVSLKDYIWSTDIRNLYFVFAGHYPSNPTGLLNHPRFAIYIEECKKVFDYVIIDSAPMASVIDTAIICKHADGVVFVVGSDMVSRKIVQKSLNQIERAGGNLLGCVLNKLKLSNRTLYGTYGTSKYYYGAYSQYYGGNENE